MLHRVFISLLLLGSLAAANPHTLTLDDLISIALKQSPDVRIGRLDVQGAKARSKAARSFYLPTLDLFASGGRQYSRLKHQDRIGADLLSGALSASQLIYDFGKTTGQIEATDEALLAQDALLYQTVADKILQIKQLYYETLKAQGLVAVQRKNVTLLRQQLHRAQRYLKAGIRTIIDVTDAKVRFEQAKRDLENARFQVDLLHTQLEQALGTAPYGGNYTLYNPKSNIGTLSSRKIPRVKTPVSQLEQFAYTHRPLLESSTHRLKGARAAVKSIEGDYLPSLRLGGDYTSQKVNNTLVGILPQTQSHITLNLTWNLFSGFRSDAQVEEARIGVLKSASQQQNIRLGIRRQVDEAYILLRQSYRNITLNETITASAKKKLYQAQKRYENGLSDFIELQNAQQEYINALTTQVNSYYDYYIALARLDHAIGR